MKRLSVIFIIIVCFALVSCNKWELIDTSRISGTAECVDKEYSASYATTTPMFVNKVVINSERYHPAQYNVLFNASFDGYDCSKEIEDRDLYARLKIGQTFPCSITKCTYFCEGKQEYKVKYKDLEINCGASATGNCSGAFEKGLDILLQVWYDIIGNRQEP